jgi:hypothetical protein
MKDGYDVTINDEQRLTIQAINNAEIMLFDLA